MPRLFGFSIDDQQQKPPSVVAPVPKTNEDGVDNYIASGFYGQYVDIEGVYRTEYDLMKRYREMVLHPEADSAVEEVRYIDPMKMKFIRKEKKKNENENIVSNRAVDIRQAVYPEIEEYYLYTPKPNFPTQFFSSGSPASGKGG